MQFLYSVEEDTIGWRVRLGDTYLAESLTLGQAIKHARQAGHEQHERTGCTVTVELCIPEKALLLARYAGRSSEEAAAA
jgi:hypothetical protein